MKILVATNQTQGWRDNDFCWAVEDELVFFPPVECDGGSVDDNCGCRRAMAGLGSRCATTTMKVVEREELDPGTYYTLIQDALISQGYLNGDLLAMPDVRAWVRDLADELMVMAAAVPIGTVLERRGDFVSVRKPLPV